MSKRPKAITKKRLHDKKIFSYRQNMFDYTDKLKKKPDLFVMYKNRYNIRKFTYFTSFKNLFQQIKLLKITGRYYVDEILMNGEKRKPYLDLEKEYDSKKEFDGVYASIIKKLQKDIIKVFQEKYHETITKTDILLLDSSGKRETSTN